MPIVLIPFGKGTGKFWILAIIVIVLFFLLYCGYEDLAVRITNGQNVNQRIVFIAKIFSPIYICILWFVKFMGKWGVFGIIPILVIGIIVAYIFDKIVELKKHKSRKQ